MKQRILINVCQTFGGAYRSFWPLVSTEPQRRRLQNERAIERVITTYALAVDKADTRLADQVFSNGPEVTCIHPQGEEHGRAQIEADVFRNLMGSTFPERKLTPMFA
ncbi:MAG: hypothetical protein WCA20_05840 [Candidatus Sulfotelmatobacter sp.]